jgi:hypothetical protein
MMLKVLNPQQEKSIAALHRLLQTERQQPPGWYRRIERRRPVKTFRKLSLAHVGDLKQIHHAGGFSKTVRIKVYTHIDRSPYEARKLVKRWARQRNRSQK